MGVSEASLGREASLEQQKILRRIKFEESKFCEASREERAPRNRRGARRPGAGTGIVPGQTIGAASRRR